MGRCPLTNEGAAAAHRHARKIEKAQRTRCPRSPRLEARPRSRWYRSHEKPVTCPRIAACPVSCRNDHERPNSLPLLTFEGAKSSASEHKWGSGKAREAFS